MSCRPCRFNPHPAWKPDATASPTWASSLILLFQSSPGLEAGCDACPSSPPPPSKGFNPHPAWKPDATLPSRSDRDRHQRVSILTRLGSRMRPRITSRHGLHECVSILTRLGSRMRRTTCGPRHTPALSFNPHPAWKPDATRSASRRCNTVAMFQSSPGLEAGCDAGHARRASRHSRFNPHPAWKPDATNRAHQFRPIDVVSILTRLGSRMRQLSPQLQRHLLEEFQSSPGLEAGCDAYLSRTRPSRTRFNPHPAWKPDATRGGPSAASSSRRFNPHPAWKPDATVGLVPLRLHLVTFQSSPGLEAGCDENEVSQLRIINQFQSSPGLEAGCDLSSPHWEQTLNGFNPHPAWKPDATIHRVERGCRHDVSILTRLGSRMRRRGEPVRAGDPMFQSSPGLEAGCDSAEVRTAQEPIWFQSSPGLEAGCDPRTWESIVDDDGFQSSPGFEAGCDPSERPSTSGPRSFNPHPAWKPDATRSAGHPGRQGTVSILTRLGSRMRRR